MKKRGKRATFFDVCLRCYQRLDGKIIRYLNFTNYEPCNHGGTPREYYYRLPANDPRPLGLRMNTYPSLFKFYEALPVGEWVEVVAQEAA